uniref:MULE transposase domain-containing protein n=1 Tax=Brassica oleracea var. oleracea TaxID=109376 RepID=A0A0D3DIT9_BRAOL
MAADADNGALNTETNEVEIFPQDKVRILTGQWVRELDGRWIFDQKFEADHMWIQLKSGLPFEELVDMVKTRVGMETKNTSVKLSYQYPAWLEIDDGDGSTPQFISDDYEVEQFVQMRRKIEEVNLCVSIAQVVDVVGTQGKPDGGDDQHGTPGGCEDPIEEGGVGSYSEDAWHDFAMSDTPLTCPPLKETVGTMTIEEPGNTIPYYRGGITIREPSIIRLQSPRLRDTNKGKGIAVDQRGDIDCDEDDCEVPGRATRRSPAWEHEESSRNVRRQLFPPHVPEENNEQHGVSSEETEPETLPQELPVEQYNIWNRFQDALFEMLNDITGEPALFGRDAPPVIDSIGRDACTVHLWRNIKARFKSKRLAGMMGAAARAFTISEFNKSVLEIVKGVAADVVGGKATTRPPVAPPSKEAA